MSRSVTPPYDALRALEQQPRLVLRKVSAIMPMSEEMIFDHSGPEFERKGVEYTVTPTNEDWAKYHRAKSGMLALKAYDAVLGLEEVEILMPKPEVHYRFTETHEEWLARCRTLQAERKAA